MSELKDKTVSGFFWKAVEKFATFGINFSFSILIARILTPGDYGTVAMIAIFMAVSQTFIDSGFGTALVRKINRTHTDMCTVFYFNIAASLFFYLLLWFAAPFIAEFYDSPILVPITRVSALNLIVGSLSGIQSAKISIDLSFKLSAKIQFACCIFSGCIGLSLALLGYGVWAIVWQGLLVNVFRSILLWVFVRWIPNLIFSWKSFKELFSFGSKLLASALLDTLYGNIYTLVIGKFFSPRVLGLYGQAHSWAAIPSSNLTGIVQSVTFPVLSRIQNEQERLSDIYRRFLRMSAFIVFPLMVGLAVLARPLFATLLGEQWMGAVPLLQIICFSMMWYPIHAINLNILQVKGRSDYFLKLEIIKKIQGVAMLCITVPLGIMAMCYGGIVTSLLCLVFNTYYTRKLIGYGFFAQMRDLWPILLQSLIMGAIVLSATLFIEYDLAKIIIGVIVGAIYYIFVARWLKWNELVEFTTLARNTFGGRLNKLSHKVQGKTTPL